MKKKPKKKIQHIIENELCVNFGLFKAEFNTEKLTEEIMNWWEFKIN